MNLSNVEGHQIENMILCICSRKNWFIILTFDQKMLDTRIHNPANEKKIRSYLTQGIEAVYKVIGYVMCDQNIEEMASEGAKTGVLALNERRHEQQN